MANRAKTDFGDDFQKKKAFDMFTNIVDGPLNTLGDICRAFQAVEPEIENHQVASILVASITDVLRDYESVLVVKR